MRLTRALQLTRGSPRAVTHCGSGVGGLSAGMTARVDALDLARALISRPSVTPADAGAMDVLQAALAPAS